MTVFYQNKKPIFRGSSEPVFPFSPSRLFAGGAQGVWLKPIGLSAFKSTSDLTLCSAGETSGFVLDNSQGVTYAGGEFLNLGGEYVANGDFSNLTGWFISLGGETPLTEANIVDGALQFTSGSEQPGRALSASIPPGSSVFFKCRAKRVSGTVSFQLRLSRRYGASAVVVRTIGNMTTDFVEYTAAFVNTTATTFTHLWLRDNSGLGGLTQVDDVSIKVLSGNHGVQSVSGDRPTFTSDRALENVSTDTLNWIAPAGTYTVAYRGSAGVVILDAQSLSGATNVMQATKIYEYVAVDRALGSAERRRLEAYLKSKGA